MSDSIITDRGRVDLEDGGAGNTEDLSSFVASLSGENLGNIENLSYNLGFRFLEQGDEDIGSGFDDEVGYVLGVNYQFNAHQDVTVDILAELASIDNFEGVRNQDQDYYSVSVITSFAQNWNVTYGHTTRDIDGPSAAEDFDDSLHQLSAGYDFNNGFTAELGYRYEDVGDIETDTVGFLVRYTKDFSFF